MITILRFSNCKTLLFFSSLDGFFQKMVLDEGLPRIHTYQVQTTAPSRSHQKGKQDFCQCKFLALNSRQKGFRKLMMSQGVQSSLIRKKRSVAVKFLGI